MSLAGATYSQAQYDEVVALSNVAFVFAAGNEGVDIDVSPRYPAAYSKTLKNVVSVGALALTGSSSIQYYTIPWVSSNSGPTSVQLYAPGEAILSTFPVNSWRQGSGTSFAAPFVTGALALMWNLAPGLSATRLISLLLTNGTQVLPGLSGRCTTSGRSVPSSLSFI